MKVIGLKKLWNFVVDDDFKLSCHAKLCLDFKIWNFQITLDGKSTKIKIVRLEMLWNFIADNFLIWNLVIKNIFEVLKFEIQIL
jgi:hypothetical protein